MATLEELEKRVTSLEEEVARLRQPHAAELEAEVSARPAMRRLSELCDDQTAFSAGISRVFREMGITGTPVGAEKVQQMVAANGIKAEDNEFSQGIIDMREE